MKRNVFSYKIDHFVEKRDGCSSGGAKSLGRQWTEESLIGSRNGHSQGALSAPGRAEGAAAFGAQRARPRSGLPQTSTVRPGPSVDGGFSHTAAPPIPVSAPASPLRAGRLGGGGEGGLWNWFFQLRRDGHRRSPGQHLASTRTGHRSRDPGREPDDVLGESSGRAEVPTSVFYP